MGIFSCGYRHNTNGKYTPVGASRSGSWRVTAYVIVLFIARLRSETHQEPWQESPAYSPIHVSPIAVADRIETHTADNAIFYTNTSSPLILLAGAQRAS